jgi:hypothetical protein
MRPETRQRIGDAVLVLAIVAAALVLAHQVRHFLQTFAADSASRASQRAAMPCAVSSVSHTPMTRTSIARTAARAHSTSVVLIPSS